MNALDGLLLSEIFLGFRVDCPLRGRDAFPFPEFGREQRNPLRDVLDNPPKGSADQRRK